MDEMIERCARALAARHYAERFAKAKDDPHVQMNVDGNWHIFAEDARTVMEAMREPDDAMRLASKRYKRKAKVYSGPECYRQMLDAALATPPAEG